MTAQPEEEPEEEEQKEEEKEEEKKEEKAPHASDKVSDCRACGESLRDEGRLSRHTKTCGKCTKKKVVELPDGSKVRFCFQHRKFEPLECFERDKTRCKEALDKLSAKRKRVKAEKEAKGIEPAKKRGASGLGRSHTDLRSVLASAGAGLALPGAGQALLAEAVAKILQERQGASLPSVFESHGAAGLGGWALAAKLQLELAQQRAQFSKLIELLLGIHGSESMQRQIASLLLLANASNQNQRAEAPLSGPKGVSEADIATLLHLVNVNNQSQRVEAPLSGPKGVSEADIATLLHRARVQMQAGVHGGEARLSGPKGFSEATAATATANGTANGTVTANGTATATATAAAGRGIKTTANLSPAEHTPSSGEGASLTGTTLDRLFPETASALGLNALLLGGGLGQWPTSRQ